MERKKNQIKSNWKFNLIFSNTRMGFKLIMLNVDANQIIFHFDFRSIPYFHVCNGIQIRFKPKIWYVNQHLVQLTTRNSICLTSNSHIRLDFVIVYPFTTHIISHFTLMFEFMHKKYFDLSRTFNQPNVAKCLSHRINHLREKLMKIKQKSINRPFRAYKKFIETIDEVASSHSCKSFLKTSSCELWNIKSNMKIKIKFMNWNCERWDENSPDNNFRRIHCDCLILLLIRILIGN